MASDNAHQYQAIPEVANDEELAINSVCPPQPLLRRRLDKTALVAEFFGTTTLVQIGCGANCVAVYLVGDRKSTTFAGEWQVAAIWALATILGVYISAPQSGGHLNPAVSLSFALVRPHDFPIQHVLPYWMIQLLGGFVAGIINMILFTTSIKKFEDTLKAGELLKSASGFGDYWR